jgi:hypothetical protein
MLEMGKRGIEGTGGRSERGDTGRKKVLFSSFRKAVAVMAMFKGLDMIL